jgi:hypothetical protein
MINVREVCSECLVRTGQEKTTEDTEESFSKCCKVRSVEDTMRSERIMQHLGRNDILSVLCGYDFKILQKSRREER